MRQLLTLIVITIFALGAKAQFQGLIINEFSQGDQQSREYIELLVVGDRTCTDSTADLRGWIFDDQNGWYGIGNVSTGHYRFANVSGWASVPFGSIILLYNSTANQKNISITAADDPTDANHDYSYILPINSGVYIEENIIEPVSASGPTYSYPPVNATAGYTGSSNAWQNIIGLNNGGDVICTVSPLNRASAYFSIAYNFPNPGGFQVPVVGVGNVGGGNNCYLNSANYSNAASWVTGNADPVSGAVNETPGAPNGGANTSWINSMRTQVAPAAPGVNIIQPSCDNSTGTIVITSPFGPGYSYSKDGNNYNPFNTLFTSLSPGVYSITVKYNNCVSPPTIVTINAAPTTPAIPVVTIAQPDCNSMTATVTINSPTGAGLVYSISGTYQSSNIFPGVSPGPYGVTAKNASGCVSIATIITVDPPPPTPPAPSVTIISQPDCPNPTGSININSPAGMSYSVDGINYSNTSGLFTNLAPGTYNVTAKNNFGCVSPVTPITINMPAQMPPTPVLTVGQTSCSSTTGTIIINSPAGAGLLYSVDGISYTTQTVYNGLVPGSYFASVQSPAGCITPAVPVVINTAPFVPPAPATTIIQPTCTTPTGTINIITPVGLNYSIDGINYSNSGVFSSLVPGSYNVSAQSGNGCISPASNVIINQQPVTPAATVNSPMVCPGNAATINVSVTPQATYNYVWTVPSGETNPGNVPNFNATTAGVYSVTVTNISGCSTTASGTLNITSVSTVTADDKVVCQNGSVQLTGQPAGGTWSGSGVTGNIFNAAGLSPGTFQVSYTINSGGCSGIATATITVASTPSLPVFTISQPDCISSTGSINISSPTGAGYTYSIDAVNYVTNPVFNNLIPGSYLVNVQNNAGCNSSTNFVIQSQPLIPAAPNVIATQPSCGGNPGAIAISNPGSGFLYSIDGINYVANNVFGGLGAGSYSVTAKIPGGCVSAATLITINNAPPSPAAPVLIVGQPTCLISTGTVTITSPVAGGFLYSTDGVNYQATPGFTLIPGNYSVTVKDNNGCVSPATPAIVNTAPIAAAAPSVTIAQPVCFGDAGAITIINPGAGLTYSIDGANYQMAVTFTGLSAGNYTVTSKNAAGCVSNATLVVINNAPLLPPSPAVTIVQPTCLVPTGTVSITSPISGNFIYSIDGLNYQATTIFAALQPGTYPVTVKDINGCVSNSIAAIINTSPSAPSAPVFSVFQPNCTSPTGSINISSPAGTGLSYSVDGINYSGNPGFTNLAPGSYQVSVQNNSGCISPAVATVINAAPGTPPAPVANIIQPTCGSSAGSIHITSPTGAGLLYSIDGLNYQSAPIFNNLATGSYNLTAQNSAGCVSPISTALINQQPGTPAIPLVAIVHPNCNVPTGNITVNFPSGVGMSYSIDGLNYFSSPVFNQLPPGNYTVRVKNAAGCVSDTMVAINQPPANFSANLISTTSQLICPVPDPIVPTITATTSVAGSYSYAWTVPAGVTNPGNVASFIVNTPGQYVVTITNSSGCSNAASINMTLVNPVTPSFADDKQVCLNSSVNLTSQIPGGTWSGLNVNGSAFNAIGISPGSYPVYYLAVTNNYCIYSVANITVVPLPTAPAVSVTNHCNGTSTLAASNYSGSLLWSNNATVPLITVSTGGNYWVTQTVNGCSSGQAVATAAPFLTQVHSQNVTGCGSVIFNGNSFFASSVVRDTIRSVSGCDSIINVANIIVKQPSFSSIAVCKGAGEVYDFNGLVLNVSGHYIDTLTASNGCDSIVHLDLVISTTKTNTVTGCGSVVFNGNNYLSSTVLSQTIKSIVTGCDSIIINTNIVVNPRPVIAALSDRVACKGDTVHLTANANAGTIHWLGFGSGNSVIATPTVSTTYVVVATSAAGCTDTGSVTIAIMSFDVQLTASNNQAISGTTVTLQSYSSSSYQVLSWAPADLFPDQKVKSQSLIVDSSLTIMLIAQSIQGCKDTAYTNIIANPLDDIFIPDAFTPNGDGKNDVFRVLGGTIQSLDLKIFNRWGEMIFSSRERTKGWDGTYSGIEQASATYVYTLTVVLRSGKKVVRKGTVTLIR